MSSEVFARDHYEREDIARIYGQWKDLLPAEKVLLEIYRERIQGQRVLDLGCGGGRTSPWLHALAAEYVGVDYSARMIEVCRARYPQFVFEQGDATDLASFGDASFDFVLFSYNGIDPRRGARMAGASIFESTDEAEAIWGTAQHSTRCYVFQSFEWCHAWMETVGSRQKLLRALPISPSTTATWSCFCLCSSKESELGGPGLSRRAARTMLRR